MRRSLWMRIFLFLPFVLFAMQSLAAAKVELEWQVWGRPGEIRVFKEVIAEFERLNPDIQVNLSEYSWDDHHKTLDLRLAGGTSPDIYRTIYPYFGRYMKAGYAVDLTKYFPEGYWKRFWPSLLSFVEDNGKYYAVPQMTDTNVVFYNADVFRAAGLSAPTSIEEAWTWDDWERIGRAIKERGLLPYGIAGA
ncbi:MAG: extracellular solute-binding protein, partial [Candidatus Caldatribacterium sp.]|nr:extracellular solute-binding protein [Candidatus Caldatribacterium sp.]